MKDDLAATRTHEPALREVVSDLDGLRALVLEKIQSLKLIIDERDRLYKERDESRKTAVDAALAAAKEQNKQTFESSEKAIVKAEEGQRSYNASHNDLARKMDEQNKATMPRTETEARFTSLTEKIDEVRNVVAAGGGLYQGGKAVKDEARNNIALVFSAVMVLIALATMAFALLKH